MSKSEECQSLRDEISRLQINNEKYLHMKERHSQLIQENCDLRDELTSLRKQFETDIQKVKQTNKDLNE